MKDHLIHKNGPFFLSSCFVLEKRFKVEKGEYVKKPTFSICSSMLCNYAGVIAKMLQTLNMNKNFENKDGGPRFGRGSTATRFRNSQSESRMSFKFAAKLTRQHLIRDMYVIVMF